MSSHKNAILKYEQIKCSIHNFQDGCRFLLFSVLFFSSFLLYVHMYSFVSAISLRIFQFLLDNFYVFSVCVCDARDTERNICLTFFLQWNHSANINVNFRLPWKCKSRKRIFRYNFIYSRVLISFGIKGVTEVVLIFAKRCTMIKEKQMCKYLLFALWTMHPLISIRFNLHFICYFSIHFFPFVCLISFSSLSFFVYAPLISNIIEKYIQIYEKIGKSAHNTECQAEREENALSHIQYSVHKTCSIVQKFCVVLG